MSQKVRYEEMLPHEIVAVREACPVAYVPLGCLEWHGEQNCVGTDAVKMHALAVQCAKVIGGLVMPPMFFGDTRESLLSETSGNPAVHEKMGLPSENFAPGYMHTAPLEEALRCQRLFLHILFQMQSLGFRAIVLMPGHYPLFILAKAAVEIYSLYGTSKAWTCIGYELVQDEIPDAGDHAAAWETSLMMHLRPDLVDMSRLPEGDPDPYTGALIGIWGRDPRTEASAEFGKRGVDIIVRKIGEKVKELLSS